MQFILRLAALVVAAGLLVVMLGPFQGAERAIGLHDLDAHALAFAWLAVCFHLWAPKRSRLQIWLLTVGLGVFVEIVQGLTGRSASFSDLAADALGAGLVALLWPWPLRAHPIANDPSCLDEKRLSCDHPSPACEDSR